MKLFVDSSALVKRYIEEPGSESIEGVLGDASALGVVVFCAVEVLSGLRRRTREGSISERQYRVAKETLLAELADMELMLITASVISGAVEIVEQFPIRAADALHVSCARLWPADLFVSADKRQCVAARGVGLLVAEIAAK